MFEAIQKLVAMVAVWKLPATIEWNHPGHSPLAGMPAGMLTLKRGENSKTEYVVTNLPTVDLYQAVAQVVSDHKLRDLTDLASYLTASAEFAGMSVWVDDVAFGEATIRVVNVDHPERGKLTMAVKRHPSWVRWSKVVNPNNLYTDLSHAQVADLVLDGQEDLKDPKAAYALCKFRGVRSVEYDADLGDSGHEAVRVTFKGTNGAKADLGVPRELELLLPAYAGAWDPGEEPRHLALIRLRVVPPKDDGAPTFRLSWADAPAYELTAARALVDRTRDVLGKLVPVYQGTPSSARYVLPK
jgi:hypothetical protein